LSINTAKIILTKRKTLKTWEIGMKTLRISILMAVLVGFAAHVDCKPKEAKKEMAKKNEMSYIQELEKEYTNLESKFEELEKKREFYLSKNPSQDEMAQLDYEIMKLRNKANEIYDKMQEIPQFAADEKNIKRVPASPKYIQECLMDTKNLTKEVKQLQKSMKK
jgi:hypothetical protein